LIRVHSSTSRPGADEAFVAVPYRNYWFWVAVCPQFSIRTLVDIAVSAPFSCKVWKRNVLASMRPAIRAESVSHSSFDML